MIWLVCIPALLLWVALSGLFSGAETGVYCLNRLRLRLQSDEGRNQARRLRRLLDDEQQALAIILVGTNLANYLATVTAAVLLGNEFAISDRAVETYTTVLVTPLLFVFAEVLPKNLFQRDPDRLLYRCSLALAGARWLFFPAAWGIRHLSSLVMRVAGPPGAGRQPLDQRDRVAALLQEALASSKDVHHHGEFVERVLRLSDTRISEVMVPLDQVISVPADTDRAGFLRLVERTRHTRLPVYQDDRSRFIGIAHAHDLLADPSWERVGQRLQPLHSLRPDDSVALAVVQVRRTGLRMAIVDGADGRPLGIVTVKDLLEEIVGELAAW
jgi:putative hemolysin